jgi:ligand-binding SRPBCC domain-containing protein
MPTFELVTLIAAPPDRVFDLSLDVDVHTESMAGSSEEAVDGATSGRLKQGEIITWRARHFGIYWRMTAKIETYAPPSHFADEQLSGPFTYWRHAHYFDADAHGGTIMRDLVDYQSPLGVLGVALDAFLLRRYMRRLICGRNKHLKEIAEHGDGSDLSPA